MSDMGNTGDVGVRLVVDGQDVWSSKFNKARSDVKALGDEARRQQGAARDLGSELDKAAKQAGSAFSDAGSAISDFVAPLTSLTSSASSVVSSMIRPLGYVTAGFTAAAGAATYFGLKTYSSIEQANAAFSTLLGNAQAGKEFTAQLKNMANLTPFTFQNIMPAAEMMLNSGDNQAKALKDISAIGNAASAADPDRINAAVSGISLAIEQIRQEPKLTGDNIRQLEAWNLNPYGMLSAAAGKNVNSSNIHNIEGTQAADVLLAAMDKKYGGAMDAQQKTLSGNLSTLHDVVGGDLANAAAPIALLLERDMPTITTNLGKLATEYGHVMNIVVTDSEILWRNFKSGGMDAVLQTLGSMTGTGGTLVDLWKHIKSDSADIANLWKNGLYPAIRDVSGELGPLVLGPLGALDEILHWMARNPDAARVIFDGIGMSFATFKIVGLIGGLSTALGALRTAFFISGTEATVAGTKFAVAGDEAAVAESKIQRGGLTGLGKGMLAVGVGLPAAEALRSGVQSSKNSKTGMYETIGGAAGTGAVIGGTIGSVVPVLGTGVGAVVGGLTGAIGGTGYELFKHLPGQANGGMTSASGWSMVGERGPELQWMPKGATVVPLDKAGSMGARFQQITFANGSVQIDASGMDPEKLADTLVQALQDRIARQ